MAKRVESKERLGFVSILILLAMLAICYICALTVLTPKRYNVVVGGTASETIAAPRTIEDTATTEALREAARNETRTIYKLDETLIEQYEAGANKFFEDARAFRERGNSFRYSSSADATATERSLSLAEWMNLIPDVEMQDMLRGFDVPLSTEEGWWLLYVEDSELLRLQDAVLPKLITSLQSGIEESSRDAKLTAYIQELQATSLSEPLKSTGEKVLSTYFRPTYVPDERATENAREEAASAVAPVEIKRGEVIVEEGQPVTQAQYDLLRKLELVRSDQADLRLNLGAALLLLCVFCVFTAYLIVFQKAIILNKKKMMVVGVSTAISAVAALGFYLLSGRIPPVLIGAMMATLLLDGRSAIVAGLLQAAVVSLFAGGRGSNMLGYESMVTGTAMAVGGIVVALVMRNNQKRGTIIAGGFGAGIGAAAILCAAGLMTGKALGVVLVSSAWAIGGNLLCAILVVGTLSLWENLFDIATSARLNELSNTNNPLLRQLMTDAPGTYHHSMMTASLAEAAAEAVGADPLLCRVGAYYHDVGKLRRPIYFKENQKPNENIHDTMPAAESAAVIISHLKDGVTLLKRNKLPSTVIQIAYEHHGTTMAAYFYHKACQEAGGKQLPAKPFRYPGARPSTKESAIVHLADSCEAAVRSLDSPSKEEVEALVDKIIKGKMEDGQLAAAPLEFRDISLIQQSFLRTFAGILHERIAYPEQAKAIPEARE